MRRRESDRRAERGWRGGAWSWWLSEQEIPLCQGQHRGRFAGQVLAVGANLVGLGIDLDLRGQVVVDHVFLADGADAADGNQRAVETQPAGRIAFQAGL